MKIASLQLRRLITVAGVIAALLLGYGSIRAAAAWTAASAPMSVAPVSISTLQERLSNEQARSADLESRLQDLTSQSTQMSAALEAAQARIVADLDNASAMTKDLKAAKQKLAKLEASIAKARQAAAQRTTVVTTVVKSSAKSSGGYESEGGDD